MPTISHSEPTDLDHDRPLDSLEWRDGCAVVCGGIHVQGPPLRTRGQAEQLAWLIRSAPEHYLAAIAARGIKGVEDDRVF